MKELGFLDQSIQVIMSMEGIHGEVVLFHVEVSDGESKNEVMW